MATTAHTPVTERTDAANGKGDESSVDSFGRDLLRRSTRKAAVTSLKNYSEANASIVEAQRSAYTLERSLKEIFCRVFGLFVGRGAPRLHVARVYAILYHSYKQCAVGHNRGTRFCPRLVLQTVLFLMELYSRAVPALKHYWCSYISRELIVEFVSGVCTPAQQRQGMASRTSV